MQRLSRIVLVRHGETVGESSIRFHGANDVPLSDVGRRQAECARRQIPGEGWDRVISSSLSRAWQTAFIVAPGEPVRLEADFREIDFGRWEGLTKEEIAAVDPILYEDWQSGSNGFEFPEGERRGDFRARVLRGFSRILNGPDESVILVAHKGIVRTIAELLTGEPIPQPHPELGEVTHLIRRAGGAWGFSGRP